MSFLTDIISVDFCNLIIMLSTPSRVPTFLELLEAHSIAYRRVRDTENMFYKTCIRLVYVEDMQLLQCLMRRSMDADMLALFD